jgi:archaeal flagellar protein FlaJ
LGNLLYIEQGWRYTAYVASAIIFVLFVVVSLVIGKYNLSLEIYSKGGILNSPIVPIDCKQVCAPGGSLLIDNMIAIGTACALAPIAFVAFVNYRFVKSVETNLPRFLRDILQGTDSGLILPKALLEAAKQDYGPVSYQMGIAMTKFSMGYDFGRSIMEASQKMRHPFAPQVGQIISEAYVAGGKTHEVLSSSVNLFNDLEQYNLQRQSELKPYTQLVYISIGIYLIIALIIVNNFIVPFVKTVPASGVPGAHFLNIPTGGASYFISIFYISGLLQCVFAGMVAGKIVDRSATAGLRHSLILIGVTIVAFSILGVILGYKLLP